MLAAQLWQLSEAGDPAVFLGRPIGADDAALFEWLLARGVLRHAGQLTHWEVCGACDCGRDHRSVRWIDGRPTAICIADRSRDDVLTAGDLVSFQIAIPALVTESAAASGLPGPVDESEAGIWHLGEVDGGHAVFAVPTRLAMNRPGLLGSLRRIVPHRDVLLLGPALTQRQRTYLMQQGVHLAIPGERLGGSAPSKPLTLDLTLVRPPNQTVRLRLHVTSLKVEVDGRVAQLPSRPFELLLLLARRAQAGRSIVSAADIHNHMFSVSTSSGRVRSLVKELRDLLATRLKVVDLIETRSNLGYTIALPSKEILLEG